MAKQFAFTVAAGVVSGLIIYAVRSHFSRASSQQQKGSWA